MSKILSSLRLVWLLAIALLLPISLPAGGGQTNFHDISRISGEDLIIPSRSCNLRTHPSLDATVLVKVLPGTPIDILRVWRTVDGKNWLQVQISSIPLVSSPNQPKRGWVDV